MKILIVGSGGREHALMECVLRSRGVESVLAAPGNAGMARRAECVAIPPENTGMIVDFARRRAVDLTLIGPELPLTLGLVDALSAEGLRALGPTRKASQLEGSKIFAKEFCRRHGIPTAPFQVFEDLSQAKACITDRRDFPVVIKADGLAAGKGVVVARNRDEAITAMTEMMLYERLGSAGRRVLVEDFIPGEEASFIVLADGTDFAAFPAAQDHKRVFDGDEGPNTGGMGAYAPAPVVSDTVRERIVARVIRPTLAGMAAEDRPYRGFLYAGLMIRDGEPCLIEYNCRMGDPEAQAILPLVESDFVEIIQAALDGKIKNVPLRFSPGYCAAVVMASRGYPGDYRKGFPIEGLEIVQDPNVFVFHAGTRERDGACVTDGGRVLAVSARGESLKTALDRAYGAAGRIRWEGAHYRRDIGARGTGKTTE